MLIKPTRIQQRRTAGWRKPEGTVGVARPSRWGNPFHVHGGTVYGLPWFELRALQIGSRLPKPDDYAVYVSCSNVTDAAHHAVRLFRSLAEVTRRDEPAMFERWIAPLRGHDLMCFCPLGMPCHADVLLDLANGDTP